MKEEQIANLYKQINAWNKAKLYKQVDAWSKEVQSIIADAQNEKATENLEWEKGKKQQELEAKINIAKNKIIDLE